MRACRLTSAGIRRFAELVESTAVAHDAAELDVILSDPEYSTEVLPAIEVGQREFRSRFEAAEYLYGRMGRAGIRDVERDVGLWAWLAAFYFAQLCPPDARGRRRPGEVARWIPNLESHQKYYRHLLAGPYRVYKVHADGPRRAMALLCGPVARPGELNEQLASRQEIVSNKAAMEVASMLYVDQETNRPKPGAAGKQRGSVRRFATILKQYDLTWDLNAISANQLLELLPKEFDAFRPQP